MKRTQQPQLPNCSPVPYKLKDIPLENGAGQALGLCQRCQGDGHIYTGEKTAFTKKGDQYTEKLEEFPGTLRAKRHRGGYTLTCNPCPDCKGAGLRLAEGSRS